MGELTFPLPLLLRLQDLLPCLYSSAGVSPAGVEQLQ